MTHSTLTSKGETTLPAPTRRALHLKPGDRISYELQGDAVVIRPQLGAMSVFGALKLFGAGKLDFVDCYLAAASIREGRTLVSFDRALAKLHGTTVMKPGDRVK